jgi:N6-adenosine-specific RNA methylase IME4
MKIKVPKYKVVLIDIPQEYNDRKLIRKDGKKAKRGIGSVNIYPCMKFKDFVHLPIHRIVDHNAMLFAWGLWPKLLDIPKLMPYWGFKYVTLGFDWMKSVNLTPDKLKKFIKEIKNSENISVEKVKQMIEEIHKPWFGVGFYAVSNSEFCLMGRRTGSKHPLPKISDKESSAIYEPHPRDKFGKIIHSRKPTSVRERIIQHFGDVKRIELFATEQVLGWDSMGYSIDGKEITQALWEMIEKNGW